MHKVMREEREMITLRNNAFIFQRILSDYHRQSTTRRLCLLKMGFMIEGSTSNGYKSENLELFSYYHISIIVIF